MECQLLKETRFNSLTIVEVTGTASVFLCKCNIKENLVKCFTYYVVKFIGKDNYPIITPFNLQTCPTRAP